MKSAHQVLKRRENGMKIGCRAHDYGKQTADHLASLLQQEGYEAAQVAMPKAIQGIDNYKDITKEQQREIRDAFERCGLEITVLGCYQDLSTPDPEKRKEAVENVCRVLRMQKELGAVCVGSETSVIHMDHEEGARRLGFMEDSIQRVVETAAKENAVFAVEPVFWHPLNSIDAVQHLMETVGDAEHLHFIFDAANLLEYELIPNQEQLWRDWLSVIGDRVDALHIKDFVYGSTNDYDTFTDMPLGKGCMRFDEISKWLGRQTRNVTLLREHVNHTCAAEDLAFMRTL